MGIFAESGNVNLSKCQDVKVPTFATCDEGDGKLATKMCVCAVLLTGVCKIEGKYPKFHINDGIFKHKSA